MIDSKSREDVHVHCAEDQSSPDNDRVETGSTVDPIKSATQALASYGFMKYTGAGEHADLFDGMIRYERYTGRKPFAVATTLEKAARELVADLDQRNCSLPDDYTEGLGGLIKIRAYGPGGGFWTKSNLSWSVLIPPGANPTGIIATLNNAFNQWRVASRNFFTFTRVPTGGDIRVAFGGTNLDSRFGAIGGVVGSAGYPPSGQLSFDSADFPVTPLLQGNGVIAALLPIALHEIGHALGLTHSSSNTSLMYPFNIASTTIDAESITAIRSIYTWTKLARFPDDRSSSDGPTFATTTSFNFTQQFDRLWMAWRGSGGDSNIWFSSSSDGKSWAPQFPIDGVRSTHGPALAAFPASGASAVLHLAWKGEGNDNRLYWTRSTNLINFEPHRRFDDRLSTTRPALAQFDGKLVMAWKASDDERIYWSTFDGVNWSPQAVIAGRSTSHAPALARFDNRLFMFWKGSGTDTRIFYATLPAGNLGIWSAGEEVSYVRAQTSGMVREVVNTDSHPAAVQRGDSLVLTYRGQPGDTAVWFTVFKNDEWAGPHTIPGAGTYTGPGAGVLDGSLLVSWKALDPDSELHFSTLG